MNIITATLGGLTLQDFTIPFLQKPLENAVDVTTLDFTTYTDFVNRKREWELNWLVLSEDDYNDLYALYEAQFSTGDYPTFICPNYSIDTPVRMYINDKDIRKNGCNIYNVTVRLIEKTGF